MRRILALLALLLAATPAAALPVDLELVLAVDAADLAHEPLLERLALGHEREHAPAGGAGMEPSLGRELDRERADGADLSAGHEDVGDPQVFGGEHPGAAEQAVTDGDIPDPLAEPGAVDVDVDPAGLAGGILAELVGFPGYVTVQLQ